MCFHRCCFGVAFYRTMNVPSTSASSSSIKIFRLWKGKYLEKWNGLNPYQDWVLAILRSPKSNKEVLCVRPFLNVCVCSMYCVSASVFNLCFLSYVYSVAITTLFGFWVNKWQHGSSSSNSGSSRISLLQWNDIIEKSVQLFLSDWLLGLGREGNFYSKALPVNIPSD